VSVRKSLLFDLDYSVLVRVIVVSLSDSVHGDSLSLSRNLEGVGGLSSDLNVVGVVSGPGGGDGLDGGRNGGDFSGVCLNKLLVSGNLGLDAGNFLLNALLLLLLDFFKSRLERINSRVQILKLRFSSCLESLLFS